MSLSFSSIVPLIGGMTLGNEKAFGSPPEELISYPDFEFNDSSLVNHFFVDDIYRVIGVDNFLPAKVDVVSTVCPCAGLSMLNSVTSGDRARGCQALVNGWIYKTAEYVMKNIRPKFILGENAPGLYTNAGQGVVDKLLEIAKPYGYNLLLIKTDTFLHGIPQHRHRTFYILTREKLRIPSLDPVHTPTLAEFFDGWKHPETQTFHFNQNPFDGPYMKYIEDAGFKIREILPNGGTISVLQWIIDTGRYDDFEDFSYMHGFDKMHAKLGRIRKKLDAGKGWWNNSPVYFGPNYINAAITKNSNVIVHYEQDRLYSDQEYAKFMGMPDDFDVMTPLPTIFQNVPVNTAERISSILVNWESFPLIEDSPTLYRWNHEAAARKVHPSKKTYNKKPKKDAGV